MALPPIRRTVIAAGLATALTSASLTGAIAAPKTKPVKPNSGQPDIVRLAGPLAQQQLTWEKCDFSAYGAKLDERLQAVPGAACATITVPRDWHNPADGNTITVRVSRTATSTGNADRQGIALVNPGGPGGSGLVWGPAMAMQSPKLAKAYDFVGFDPRGVGDSTKLECTVDVDKNAPEIDQTRAMVKGCLDNPLTPYITTEQTVYDMDFIRALLGEKKMSFVGYSYGTWLGSWYGATFPTNTHRLLLDSSTDISSKTLEGTWDLQPHTRDRQFQQHLLPWMARNPETFYMGTDPMAIREAWERAGGTRTPLGQLLTSTFILPAMYSNSNYMEAGMAVRIYAFEKFTEGQTTEEQLAQFTEKLLATPGLTAEQRASIRERHAGAVAELRTAAATEPIVVDGAFEAIRCQDGQWNTSLGYWDGWLARLADNAPFIAPFMSTPACAFWPAQTTKPKNIRKATPPTMIVQSELDAATAYEGAAKGAQTRGNTWMISVDDEGSHGLYPYLTTCVDDPVEAFMLTGATPKDKFSVCGAKPLPLEKQSFPSGASLGGNKKLKVKTVPKDVREANDFVRSLLAEQATTTP